MTATLPPLPEPSEMDGSRWGYSADDMRNHAIDAYNAGIAAQREACAHLLDLIAAEYGVKHLMFEQNAADFCAAAIRARKDTA